MPGARASPEPVNPAPWKNSERPIPRRGAPPLRLELLDAPLAAEVEGQRLAQGGGVGAHPLEILGRERPAHVVLEIEDGDDRTGERVRDRDTQDAVGPTAQGGGAVESDHGGVFHEPRLGVLDRPPDQARADPRGGSQGAAGLFVLGAETAGMEDCDLERLWVLDLDQDALLGAQTPHGVDEALPKRGFLGAAPDEHGERPGQRVEEGPLVAAAPECPEGERARGGRAALRSNGGGGNPFQWRHFVCATPEAP